jgi:sulfur-oxidizing protein SoxX
MRRARLLLALCATLLLSPAAAQTYVPETFVRPDKGHCIACHQLPDGVGQARRSDLGPRLEGARMRELGRARIRALIHDPMTANPDTVMPPFGRHRILEPAEIERLVEFLHALP